MNSAIDQTALLTDDQELDVSPEDWVPEHDHWSDMIDAEQDVFEEQLKVVMIRFQASFDERKIKDSNLEEIL